MTDADQNGLARLAHGLDGKADQQRDQQGLQDDSAGQGREHRLRDQVQQEIRGRGLLRGRRDLAGGKIQPLTRMDDIADDEADGQRDRGHADEVGQGDTADLADLRGTADRAHADHDAAEDDRGDHHLDQVDEPGADRLELFGELGSDEPHRDSEPHRDDDRDVEIVGPVLLGRCDRLSCGLW